VPIVVPVREHLPCAAIAVQEHDMQRGSLIKKSRKWGPDVWLFRWSEKGPRGKRVYRKRVIGTLEEYSDVDAARCAVTGLIAKINSANPRKSLDSMTIAQLCDHFEQRELAQSNTWRSYATKKCYAVYLKRWIVPHWGKYELSNVRTIEVESWLRRLPLAKSSCAKIRNLMSVLFNHACRYELFDQNPIHLVRQGAKRKKVPCVLTPAEIKMLVDGLRLRERTLVLLAASTGLRQSELFGLKWGDINFTEGTMNVTRSIVYGVVGPCKTESSQRPVPLHRLIVEALANWRAERPYRKPDDWVFASGRRRGRKPYWGQAILRKYIRPLAQELGIEKRIGWHTFRHTYSTLLRSVGTEFKVMQELLRHSSLRSTLDVYTQAITPAKTCRPGGCHVTGVFSQSESRDVRWASGDGCAVSVELGPIAQGKGVQKGTEMCPFCTPFEFRQLQLSSLESDGDDGARTRDLCRDSLAVLGFSTTY
jgi:integrase